MRKLIVVFAALVFTLATVGCSSGNDSKDSSSRKASHKSTTTTTETPALDPKDIDTTASPYCATWADIRGAGGPPAQDAESVKTFYSTLVPKVEKLLTESSAEIKASVQIAVDATRKVAVSGQLDDFKTDAIQGAQKKLADYAVAHCKKKK